MPGLSQYDNSSDASPQARQARGRMRGGSKLPESELRLNYGTDEERRAFAERTGGYPNPCWCKGELCSAYGEWLGHEDGLPHPRNLEDLALRLERVIANNDNDNDR